MSILHHECPAVHTPRPDAHSREMGLQLAALLDGLPADSYLPSLDLREDELGDPPLFDDDAPGEPLLPFAEWIALQASILRLHGHHAAAWLAGEIDRLADQARFLAAAGPDEFDARRDVAEDGRLAEAYDAGYDAGRHGMFAGCNMRD